MYAQNAAKIPDKRLKVLPGLWLRLPNSVTSPIFLNFYIGLKSTNALNINVFLLPTKLLPLLNYLCTAWSLISPLVFMLLALLSPSLDHLHILLRITNRSFRYASPHLWNQLPVSCQPCTKHPPDDVTLTNSPPTCSPLSSSITHIHCFIHSRLKTHLFHKSFPP